MDQDASLEAFSVALFYAVKQGNRKLARELLKAGANVNQEIELRKDPDDIEGDDYRSFTPIISAVENDYLEMVNLLLEYNPNVNDADANGGLLPLVEAAHEESLEIVRTLLAHPGIIVNARDSADEFALEVASVWGNYNMVDLLVNHGGYDTKDDYSQALHLACINGRTNVMGLLLENGADPNYTFRRDSTPPLYPLIKSGNWEAVRLLLRSGATTEIPFKHMIRYMNSTLNSALEWLSEDTTRTILGFNAFQQRDENWYLTSEWDGVVATLWFHYFGPDYEGSPPSIRGASWLRDEDLKENYKWMVHAVSSLLFLEEGNLLLPHICRVLDPSVALELCEHAGKTPLLLAFEVFPRQDEIEQQDAARGTELLIDWNPDALKVRHPETRRIPLTCAIVNQVPMVTLQKMVTCKKEKWFTSSPLQQDPVTLLPNYLLVSAGKDCYSVSDIYAFSRNYLPEMISSLQNPRVPRRGIKRRLELI